MQVLVVKTNSFIDHGSETEIPPVVFELYLEKSGRPIIVNAL